MLSRDTRPSPRHATLIGRANHRNLSVLAWDTLLSGTRSLPSLCLATDSTSLPNNEVLHAFEKCRSADSFLSGS